MKYQKGYKYRLEASARIHTLVYPETEVGTDYIKLQLDGLLILEKGYAWDGSSGPAIDTPSSIVASAAHDALYQLIRWQLLGWSYRPAADKEYYRLCCVHGMWPARAWLQYHCVRYFAGFAIREEAEKPILEV